MKPECGVFEKGGFILSGTEEVVYMVHGKWWWEGWLQDLWPAMEKYCNDEGFGERAKQKIKQRIEFLKQLFRNYNSMYVADGQKIIIGESEGTRTGIGKGGSDKAYYAIYLELGTRKMRPYPFLRPALYKYKYKFRRAIRKMMRRYQ